MSDLSGTEAGKAATRFVTEVSEHLREVFGVEESADNAVGPVPESGPGYASYVEDGAVAVIDVPLSKFISDGSLTSACDSLTASVREAIKAHMDATYRHHLEVACQGDEEANELTEGWDWDAGLPYDKLHEAGLDEIVSEAESNADLDFDTETLRFNVQAMIGHVHRDSELSLFVKANTEFEYHMSDGQMRANLGTEHKGPSYDHVVVDVDFSKAADFSDAKMTALLDVVRQSFPEREAPAHGMGR